MAAHPRIIIIFIISLLLVGCANPVVTNDAVALPSLSDTGTASPDTGVPVSPPDSTPTTEPTQAAIIEPVLPPPQADPAIPPVNPPPNFMEALHASQDDHGAFDLVDAHAMYAHYRQEVGPGMWSTPDFIKAMDTYYETVLKPRGIELKQATAAGVTYSLLTKGDQILLQFTPEGAWANYAPGGWNDQSQQIWVDAGGPVEIVIGPDNLPYLARLDPDTREVTAYLNPINTKLDNVANQWVIVVDGVPQMRWDGKALISLYDRRNKQGDLVPLLAIGERDRLMIWDETSQEYQVYYTTIQKAIGTAQEAVKADRIEITQWGMVALDANDKILLLVDDSGATHTPDQLNAFYLSRVPERVWNGSEYVQFPEITAHMYASLRLDGSSPQAVPTLRDGSWVIADRHDRIVYRINAGVWQPVEPVWTAIGSFEVDSFDLISSGYTVEPDGIYNRSKNRLIIDLSSGNAEFPLPKRSGTRISYEDTATAKYELSVAGGRIISLNGHLEIHTPDYRYVFADNGDLKIIEPKSLSYAGVTFDYQGHLIDPIAASSSGGAVGISALYWAEARDKGIDAEAAYAEVILKKTWDAWALQQGWQRVPDWAGRTSAPSFNDWIALVRQAEALKAAGNKAGAEAIIAQTGVEIWGVDNRHPVGHVYADGSVKTAPHYEEAILLHPLNGVRSVTMFSTDLHQQIFADGKTLYLALGYNLGPVSPTSMTPFGYALDHDGRIVFIDEGAGSPQNKHFLESTGSLRSLSAVNDLRPRTGNSIPLIEVLWPGFEQSLITYWGTRTDNRSWWIQYLFVGQSLTGSDPKLLQGTFVRMIISLTEPYLGY